MSKVAPDEDLHRCDNDKDDDKATDKDKKEKDGLEGKKKNIREMDSVVDTSNRRVRILQPTASPIYISQGTEGTVACHLFGKRCALNLYKLVDSRMSFLAITCLTVLGLCFLIGDLTAADEVSISVSFVSMLVLPWGFLVFLLLKVKILRLVIKMFNTWFLILQVAAMMVCIGFIVHRPLMITMLSPTLVSTILVDAFPRQHRWKVTAFSYFILISFVVVFDLALLLSLLPIDDPLQFTINGMEFSMKAFCFGCSLNLLVFALRSVSILIFYPNCLVSYTTYLTSKRLENSTAKLSLAKRLSGTLSESIMKPRDRLSESDDKTSWALCPQFKPVYLHSKETLISNVFGKAGTNLLWNIAKSPITFLFTIPTAVGILPVFIRYIPIEVSPVFFPAIVLMGSSVGIENAYMLKQLLGTFQVWFLLAMSFTAFACVYSTMPDIRLLTSIPISAGLFFSITLDSYPNSGRFLAGCRFYAVKLSMATGIIIMLLVSDTREDYWHYDVGEISFSGAALTISCCINLTIFALRNMFVLLTNRSCLVVLQSLVEYKELSTKPSGTTGGVGGAVAGDGGDDGDESEGGDLKR